MSEFENKKWTFEASGIDGDTNLFGINIFDCDWLSTGRCVPVTDPLYGESHNFSVYRALLNGEEYEFAAGEFSNCVWGFYLFK